MASIWTTRRRRRRGLWVAALLTVAALIFVSTGSVRSDTRTLAAYLDTARSVADTEARLASTFQDSVVRLGELERTALGAALADLESSADDAVAELNRAEQPPGAAQVTGFLDIAVSSWRAGLQQFGDAMLLVIDQPDNPEGPAALQGALTELGIGDRAYGKFRTLAGELRSQLDVQSPELPEVRFVPSDNPGAFSMQAIVATARQSELLALRRDLAVAALNLNPGPVGERDGVPLVPVTDVFEVQVTVINQGNQPEESITLEIALERQDGGQPYVSSAQIAQLAPGASQTLTFTEVPAAPGQQSTLIATVVQVEGEADIENNSSQPLAFIRETGE